MRPSIRGSRQSGHYCSAKVSFVLLLFLLVCCCFWYLMNHHQVFVDIMNTVSLIYSSLLIFNQMYVFTIQRMKMRYKILLVCLMTVSKVFLHVSVTYILPFWLLPINWISFIGPKSDHWECLSVTHSVTLSKLYWCDPGVWRYQLKTCWGCYCCWCWWWGSCWQQFVADLKAEVWS